MGKAQQWSDSPRLVRMYRFVIKWSVPQQKSNTTHISPGSPSHSPLSLQSISALHASAPWPLAQWQFWKDNFPLLLSLCFLGLSFLSSSPLFFFSSSWPSCQTSGGRLAGRAEMVSGSVLWIQFQSWLCEETAGHRGSGGFRPVLFCSFPPSVSETISCVCNISHTTAVFKFS